MANQFYADIETYFDEVVKGFESINLASKTVNMFKPEVGRLANTGQTFYRPVPLQTEVVDGRDITSSIKDMIELEIPSTLTDSHIRNVPVKLTGVDLNNERIRDRMAKAAAMQLSDKLDTIVADKIADDATLLVINSGNIDSYEDLGEAEAIMKEQQSDQGKRCIFLNPRMALNVAGNLAGRGTMQGIPTGAYTGSDVPMVAGFETYQVQYNKTITGSAGTGYLVNGASQDYTPVQQDANGVPVDNRTSVLTVDTGTGAAVGDFFTISGVNSVGHINKKDTGQPKTFRIKAINGANWTISPPIVPADGTAQSQKDYATCSTTPANNAPITILNTVTKPASTFFSQDAVEIIHADYNLSDFERDGRLLGYAQTDAGVQIAMLSSSSILTLETTFRMFIWANCEVLNPELAGVYLEGQT